MPIVTTIMPQQECMSRGIMLFRSPLVALLFTLSSCVDMPCGVFLFTYAAQFPLHIIFSSPANPVC